MRERDKAIIEDLWQFRCMTRDDIASLHFSALKNPVNGANAVLKRLHRDGLIERSTSFIPYVYMPVDRSIKKDSAKIPHFLEIVQVYKDMCHYKKPRVFTVEPKYGRKGEFMEPDAFAIWRGAPIFLEVQRTRYSDTVMNEKVQRYAAYFHSGLWKTESWQPVDKPPIFPSIMMVTPSRYHLSSDVLRIIQVTSVHEAMTSIQSNPISRPPKRSVQDIHVQIGSTSNGNYHIDR